MTWLEHSAALFKCCNCYKENCSVITCNAPKNRDSVDANKKHFYADRGLPVPVEKNGVPEEATKAPEEVLA